jgi:hypothetical protein
MRNFLLSTVAAMTVLAASAIALSTDADAATRRPQHRSQVAPPFVPQDSYPSYNTFASGSDAFHTRRDVHPISGTPRWNAAGGAP